MKRGSHENGRSMSVKALTRTHKPKHLAARSIPARMVPAVRTLLALVMVVLLPTAAFADTWDLTLGSVDIGFQNDVQYVTQNTTSAADASPVITSNGVATENTISVSSGEGQTAQFTVQDVVITVDQNTSGIDIADGSTVEMTVSGTNSVDTGKVGNTTGSAATVHVGDAELTIQGDDSTQATDTLSINDNGKYTASDGAGLGSNKSEDFAGTINITGDVTVSATGTYHGAGIGSGSLADFSGEVNVTDGAELVADSCNNAAAIGAGESGDFTGDVVISDSSVTATSYNNGAGIGGGYKGDFAGTVEIDNSDVFARAGNISGSSFKGEAAGIGAGYDGDFTGQVNISDSTVEAVALHDGAGIGAGGRDKESQIPSFSGSVNIDNSTVTAITCDRGTPIGAPEVSGEFSGSVSITGNSNVTLVDGQNTSIGTETLIGGNTVKEGASVSVDGSSQISVWSGTVDKSNISDADRNCYKDALKGGSIKVISMTAESLASIIKGVEINLAAVPKMIVNAVTADDFWENVKAQIAETEKGGKLIVDVGNRLYIPMRIIEFAQECQVTLVIVWDGGEDIEIRPDHSIESSFDTISIASLPELLKK